MSLVRESEATVVMLDIPSASGGSKSIFYISISTLVVLTTEKQK